MRNLTKAAIIASIPVLAFIGYNTLKKDEPKDYASRVHSKEEQEETRRPHLKDLEGRIAEMKTSTETNPRKPVERDEIKVDQTRQYLTQLIRDVEKYTIDKDSALDHEEIEGILRTNYDSSTDLFDLAKIFIESGKLHDAGTTLKLYSHQLGIENPERAEELKELIKEAQNALWGAGQTGEKYASSDIARHNGEGLRDLVQLSHMTALNKGEIEGEEGSRVITDLTPEEKRQYVTQQNTLTKSVLERDRHSLRYRDNALPGLLGLFEKPKEGAEWLSISDKYSDASQNEIERHLSEEKNGKTYTDRFVKTTFRNLENKYRQGEGAFKQYVKHGLREAMEDIGTLGNASSKGLIIPGNDKIKLREVSKHLADLINARDYREQGEVVEDIRRIVYERPARRTRQ